MAKENLKRMFKNKIILTLKSIKEYNDNKNTNSGLKIYRSLYRSLNLSNLDSVDVSNGYPKIKRVERVDTNRIINPELIVI